MVSTEPPSRATVGADADERLVWVGRLHSIWPTVVGGVIGTMGGVVAVLVGGAAGIGLIVAGSCVTLLTSVHVTADRHGLTVVDGPFEWPRTRIALTQTGSTEAIDVRPMQHGGWGYRGSLHLFPRAAVVVRAGQGIRLDLVDGKRFVVTVDDAENGAGTINDLVTR